MAWTTPRTWVAGEVVTAALLNTHLRDNLNAVSGIWQSWTPTWSTTGTAPSVGNGTFTCSYTQIGKTVHYRMHFVMGSTTTYGTGTWLFSLPVTPKTLPTDATIDCTGQVQDFGTSSLPVLTGRLSGSSVVPMVPTSSGNVILAFVTSVFYAWAVNDFISIAGSYEAA